MPNEDQEQKTLAKILTSFGDQLSLVSSTNTSLIDQQLKNFEQMQRMHEDRTNKLLN